MFLCRKCQINGKYWLHYSYLFHFTLSVPHESNLSISFFFLLRFRIKNSYLCGIIGETRFFYRFFFLVWLKDKRQHFLCSFDKHTTFDSRLNIRLVLAIILLFLGIFLTVQFFVFIGIVLAFSCVSKNYV